MWYCTMSGQRFKAKPVLDRSPVLHRDHDQDIAAQADILEMAIVLARHI